MIYRKNNFYIVLCLVFKETFLFRSFIKYLQILINSNLLNYHKIIYIYYFTKDNFQVC